jgi:uncharacterized protein (TIGR03435 family)
MTPHSSEDNTGDLGRRSFSEGGFGAAVAEFRRALDQRVDAHLRAHPHGGVARIVRTAAPRSSTRPWTVAAAVALVIVAIGGAIVWPRGRVYAAGVDGLHVTLADDSRVEMRAHAEMTVGRTSGGIQIDLKKGDIIVSAAEQRGGHLYVQTKDMTIALSAVAQRAKVDGVGTVFLVNAGRDGSRVAVIEGEVRVQDGKVETKLRPGQQVATSTTVAARPLTEAIAWSRRGDAYAAILASFEKGMAQTSGQLRPLNGTPGSYAAALGQADAAGANQEFEEASIRECDPDNLPPTPQGARGGGANSFQMTPGRTYALCMTVATLIRTAYGYGPADLDFLNGGRRGRGPNQFTTVYGLGVEDGVRVRGGPDWVRTDRYTIDAVASGPADAETMRGPMLRALLERRFQLKAHIGSEQVPAFTLAVAPGGLKMKPVIADNVNTSGFVNTGADATGSACEAQPTIGRGQPAIIRPAKPGERQPPPPSTPGEPVTILFRNFVDVRRGEKPTCGMSAQRNGPNQVVVAGGMTLEALAGNLASPLGGVVVMDKTGNTDKFNFVLEFVLDENTPGPRFLTPRPAPEPSDIPRAATIFAALEEQLGLRLERTSRPREFIVIDAVERPTPN